MKRHVPPVRPSAASPASMPAARAFGPVTGHTVSAGRGHDFASVAVSAPLPAAPAAAPGPIQCHPRDRFDALGTEKWREFIDAKDHETAQKWAQENGKHPGEFYDYRNGEKALDSWRDFQHADAFVQQRLGTRLSANEYGHVNMMAMHSAAYRKGWRGEEEVTWGLPKPASEKEAQALTGKGLELMEGNQKVRVPMPREGIKKAVQGHLDAYYTAREAAQDTDQHVGAITTLYQNLEALHAFKDGTSRTNHLVLNKLLTEVGLHPAVLHEPDSPVHTHDEFKARIYAGVRAGREIAARQDEESSQKLGASREEIRDAVAVDAQMRRRDWGKDEKLDRWFDAPRPEDAVRTFEPGELAPAAALQDVVQQPQQVMGVAHEPPPPQVMGGAQQDDQPPPQVVGVAQQDQPLPQVNAPPDVQAVALDPGGLLPGPQHVGAPVLAPQNPQPGPIGLGVPGNAQQNAQQAPGGDDSREEKARRLAAKLGLFKRK
jgi:hypothetical protein